MKKNYNDLILLSVYLDNELTDEEKEYIEKKLKTSIELQNKFEELRKVKNLTVCCKTHINDADNLEQKVFNKLLEDKAKPIFKDLWLPSLGLITVVLLVFVSFNVNPDFFKSFLDNNQKLVSNFNDNLKPLFIPSELTSEDLFNFAIYEELPLKGNSRILKIGIDNNGKEYFEVRKYSDKTNKNNLSNFLTNLNLTDDKKSKVDSLFKDYAYQLSKNILVGEENSIAINSSVWNLRKTLVADFLALTRQLDKNNFDRLAKSFNLPITKDNFAWNKPLNSVNKFIVFTPDSIFTSDLGIQITDFAELNSQIINNNNFENQLYKIDFDSLLNPYDSKVKVVRRPDVIQFHFEEIEIPDIEFPEFYSLVEMVEKSSGEQTNLSLFNKNKSNSLNENNQQRSFTLPSNDFNVDSILEKHNRNFENNLKNNNNSKNNLNKLESVPKDDFQSDSDNEEIKLQIEKLREEIRKFREQFLNYLKEDSIKFNPEKNVIIENIEI